MIKEKELLSEQPNNANESIPETPATIKEVSYCQICGRRLTDPKSVERKIGPVCMAKAVGA